MRYQSSGQFELPLPAAEAIWLFTPEGERVWAPGWNLTPGHHAGTVAVRCVDAPQGRTTVHESYDMSLLGDRDASGSDVSTPERFDEMMREWSLTISTYLHKRMA